MALNELPNRPYPPELTKKRFADAVEMYQTFVTQPTDRNIVAVNLEACFAGNPNAKAMRKAVMQYLIGKTSTKDLTEGETIAFKKWLAARPDESGKWQLDFNTMQEAIQINAIALKEEGQQEPLMTDTPPEHEFNPDDVTATKVTPPADPMPATHNIINKNQQEGAEWNVFYYDPSGFDCHLKLHGWSGQRLLANQVKNALKELVDSGCIPKNGAPTISATGPAREDLPQDGSASSTWCTIHECEMGRHEKHGDVWYSHKIAGTENDWCRGEQ